MPDVTEAVGAGMYRSDDDCKAFMVHLFSSSAPDTTVRRADNSIAYVIPNAGRSLRRRWNGAADPKNISYWDIRVIVSHMIAQYEFLSGAPWHSYTVPDWETKWAGT